MEKTKKKERKATAKQLAALEKARKARNKKKVRDAISETKKKVKKTISKSISKARKTVAKATKKALDSTVKRLKKQGLAGAADKKIMENKLEGFMTAEEAKKYVKEFIPNNEILNSVESQIKKGQRHIQVYTTMYIRTYAEDCADYFRKLGYNARIVDLYNSRTGQRGGNYLQIDL